MNKIKILVGSRSRTAAGRVHRIIQHITGCTHKQEVAARTWSNEYTLELQLGSGLADEAAAGRRERRNDELVTYVWLQARPLAREHSLGKQFIVHGTQSMRKQFHSP